MKGNIKRKITRVILPVIVISTRLGGYALAQGGSLTSKINDQYGYKNELNISDGIDLTIYQAKGMSGVSNLFYYDGSSIAVGMNTNRDGVLKKDSNTMDYYRELYGDIYSFDNEGNKSIVGINSLNAEFGAGYSPGGGFIDYIDESGISRIYNIKDKTSHEYSKNELYGNWSKNGEYLIKYGVDNNYEDKFYVINTDGKLVNQQSVSDTIQYVAISNDFNSDDGKCVYFTGRSLENNTVKAGLFKMDMTDGSIKTVLSFDFDRKESIENPGTDLEEHPEEYLDVHYQSNIYQYELMTNGDIIFNGLVDNVNGIYRYSKEKDTVKPLLVTEGGIGFSISPKEDKIVYTIDRPKYEGAKTIKEGIEDILMDEATIDKEKEESNIDFDNVDEQAEAEANPIEEREIEISVIENETNVYVANISNIGLEDITYIKEDSFATDFKWSEDGKELLYLVPDKAIVERAVFK